jgi:CDP-6-deoxy-D-xylo-4-hexulose-3-dehydrase
MVSLMRIPLASSGLRAEDVAIAIEVLQSGNLTMGKHVKNFEIQMADYLGVSNFVMMNSGSSANLAIFEAILRPTKSSPLLEEGDGVLVPAIAWPTTIWPIIQLGLHPVFVDVEADSLAIDLEKAQHLINLGLRNIKAIFPIHPLGYGVDPSRLDNFSRNNNLVQINDVCESLGSWYGDKHSGTSGLAGSFSFYFSHHITTMEGGGVATNNEEFADDLRSIRSHGWSRDRKDSATWSEHLTQNDSKFLFVSTGYNIRPMEIQAAIGSSQIRDIDSFISKRRNIASRVLESVKGTELSVIGDQTLMNQIESKNHSWMLIPIQCKNAKQKNVVVKFLNELEIETRPVLTGNFLSQPAIERIDKHHESPLNFPVSNHISESCFLVGAHHDLSPEQIDFLSQSIEHASQLKYD